MGQPDILVQAVVTCMEITNNLGTAPHFPIRCGHTIEVRRGNTMQDILDLHDAIAKHFKDAHNMEIE